jgi:hypothetical protein
MVHQIFEIDKRIIKVLEILKKIRKLEGKIYNFGAKKG